MKNLLIACICTAAALSLSGCTAGDIIDRFRSFGETEVQEPQPDSPRVYMDEVHGILKDFSGSQLTMTDEDNTYIFDISQAALECEGGMITGDEISVIYEGQLEGTDTSTVKALKVVDEYHKKVQLEEKTTYGQVQNLTPNSITLKSRTGKTATYPVTGAEQYYQNGIRAGAWVYLHYKGSFGETDGSNSTVLNASHLKVLSVSDIDPLVVPAPTPTPTPAPTPEPEKDREQQLKAVIRNINLNSLQVSPEGTDVVLNLDISKIPCHFSGGPAVGSGVSVSYTGEFNGRTLEGITVTAVTGDVPEELSLRNLSYTVSGEITGSTSNTITVLTTDGVSLTFHTDEADNTSTGGLLTGSSVKITYNPADSRDSNIYNSLKIEDA